MPEGEERSKRIIEEAERFMQWFQAIEFSHNRIQQIAQKVKEQNVLDIIEKVLILQNLPQSSVKHNTASITTQDSKD